MGKIKFLSEPIKEAIKSNEIILGNEKKKNRLYNQLLLHKIYCESGTSNYQSSARLFSQDIVTI